MKLELNDFQKGLLKHISKESYQKVGEKTTIAVITIHNGFEIVGHSGCVDPANFNFEIGKHYALVDALTQLGKYLGFHVQEVKHQAKVTIEGVKQFAKEAGMSEDEIEEYISQLEAEVAKSLEQYK
ncbi:hypothetical protein [Bacillus phage vB_BanS-Thrax3]|nr:hypothetical protein [Bacillus phage vB_BanS-Thrax3]